MSQRVLALDPNARGLRAAARYERSKELLQVEIMRFDQCQPGSAAADPAQEAIATQPHRGELEDAADRNLTLAEDLWKQEQKACASQAGQHAPNPDDQAMERVLSRLSKQ